MKIILTNGIVYETKHIARIDFSDEFRDSDQDKIDIKLLAAIIE